MLYIKVGDDFIPYDESSFWTVTLTDPDRTKSIKGKATKDDVDAFVATLIDKRETKPAGRGKSK